MGMLVHGRKVRESATEVAYSFGFEPDVPDGVLVIPVDDVQAWYVEGSDAHPKPVGARRIMAKAYRLRCAQGSWPDDASFHS